MKYHEYQNELNDYVKELCRLIYRDYRDFFGTEDDLFLYELSTLENSVLKLTADKTKKEIVYSIWEEERKYPTICCNPLHPSLQGKTIEEKILLIKEYLPYEIFSFLIDSTKRTQQITEETLEFGKFLNQGLIQIITEEFAAKEKIKISYQHQPNKKIALDLLTKIPQEIDKRKMIFQNDFLYMLEFYQMLSGKNLYEEYQNTYIKEKELLVLEKFVNKYINLQERNTIWYKIMENRSYAVAIEEITTYLIANYKGKELESCMIELSTCLTNYSVQNIRPNQLSRKTSNGFLISSVIIASCIFLGIILTILIK